VKLVLEWLAQMRNGMMSQMRLDYVMTFCVRYCIDCAQVKGVLGRYACDV